MQKRMPVEIEETLNFAREMARNRTIEGVYPIAKLMRLAALLASSEGLVHVKLAFTNSVGFAALKGKLTAKVQLQCQRCLEPLDAELSGQFKFALVNSEDDIALLPDEFEPCLLAVEEQSVIELIEDELLLCLPMVSVHDSNCSSYMTQQNREIQQKIKAEREAEKKAEHPFAALQALKKDSKGKVN